MPRFGALRIGSGPTSSHLRVNTKEELSTGLLKPVKLDGGWFAEGPPFWWF